MSGPSNFAFGSCLCCNRCPDANGTLIASITQTWFVDGVRARREMDGGFIVKPSVGTRQETDIFRVNKLFNIGKCLRVVVETHYDSGDSWLINNMNVALATARVFESLETYDSGDVRSTFLPVAWSTNEPSVTGAYCEERFRPWEFTGATAGFLGISQGYLVVPPSPKLKLEYILRLPSNTSVPYINQPWPTDENGDKRPIYLDFYMGWYGWPGLTQILKVYLIGKPEDAFAPGLPIEY